MQQDLDMKCPVCQARASLLDVLDFNKPCLTNDYALSGMPIYYAICDYCDFCFAPAIYGWSQEEFRSRIYNDDYVKVDPEYLDARPARDVERLHAMFGNYAERFRHLDYGGGRGRMAELLRQKGWQSTSYDPFVDGRESFAGLGQYDLITAFEVFEHVADVEQLFADLLGLLAPEGLVVFSTHLSDGHIARGRRLDWWYAAPRNGHISLFSGKSLAVLAQRYQGRVGTIYDTTHMFFRQLPAWAKEVFSLP